MECNKKCAGAVSETFGKMVVRAGCTITAFISAGV